MSPTRTLLSLPADVLLEILAHLLVDTPRAPERTAVVRTCQLLHELGTPVLYRVVDLTEYGAGVMDVTQVWETLFGARGTLTDQSGIRSFGSSVHHLRLGGPVGELDWPALTGFEFRPVDLTQCTSLTLDWYRLPFLQSPTFSKLLASLPLVHLDFCLPDHSTLNSSAFAINSLCVPFTSRLFGSGIQPWPSLDTGRIRGPLSYDQHDEDGKPTIPRMSFSAWSFKVLAVNLPKARAAPAPVPRAVMRSARPMRRTQDQGLEAFCKLFFGYVAESECADWWRGLERIELRESGPLEAEFHRRLDLATKAEPLKGLQQRILPLIVFIDDDGTERKLIEPVPTSA